MACGDGLHTYAVLIHAHGDVGPVFRYLPGVPAGCGCTVTETATGHTSTVAAVTAGGPKTVTIGANCARNAHALAPPRGRNDRTRARWSATDDLPRGEWGRPAAKSTASETPPVARSARRAARANTPRRVDVETACVETRR